MIFIKKMFLVLGLSLSFIAIAQQKELQTTPYQFAGRVEHLEDNKVVLIGSASSVSFHFKGKSCSVTLQTVHSEQAHEFVSIVLDGEYIDKIRVEAGAAQSFPVVVKNNKKVHELSLYKATEASSGGVLFLNTSANLVAVKTKVKKKIEFIGDSITCGAASDYSTIACDQGGYFDHGDAYNAYGPSASRILDVDYLVSSVSGIGVYRNWNEENSETAIMPKVYEKLYLSNTSSNENYDFSFQPAIISIALGTNDFSRGDGKKERLPFNPDLFISNYIAFIKMIYQHNPNAKIVLLNSPMVTDANDVVFVDCLNKIKASFANDATHKPIVIFKFNAITPHGCGGHPDVADHQLMANLYAPFLKKIVNEN